MERYAEARAPPLSLEHAAGIIKAPRPKSDAVPLDPIT